MIALFAAVPFVAAGQASANSALDQYVEQVPTLDGNTNIDGTGKDKPKPKPLDPAIEKKLNSSGDDGSSLGQVAAATAPTLAMTNPGGSASGHHGKTGSAHHANRSGKSDDGEFSHLLVADTPGTGKAVTAAAGASGVNGPLAIFVAVAALAMGVFAYRRHLRSRTR